MINKESFIIQEGQCPVMLSAPHAVEHTRNGQLRYPEPQTAYLSRKLHESLDCPYICKTENQEDDANYDRHSPYKETLVEYIRAHDIKLLIDLHQMAGFRPEQICLGTGRYVNVNDGELVEYCKQAFEAQGITNVTVDRPFAASYPYTVSSYIHNKCGVPALQIEINSNLLMGDSGDCVTEAVLKALEEIIIYSTR